VKYGMMCNAVPVWHCSFG